MACEKAVVILFVSLCYSWCARAEAADSEGIRIGGYSASMLQIAVAVAIVSGLCVVDVWKTLERWSMETKDGQGMAVFRCMVVGRLTIAVNWCAYFTCSFTSLQESAYQALDQWWPKELPLIRGYKSSYHPFSSMTLDA